jgi:hypothetical protein
MDILVALLALTAIAGLVVGLDRVSFSPGPRVYPWPFIYGAEERRAERLLAQILGSERYHEFNRLGELCVASRLHPDRAFIIRECPNSI